MKAINELNRRLGLARCTQEDIRSREKNLQIKESLLCLLYSTINRENSYTPETSSITPKFFIGKGNNSLLVRLFMRERWWWYQTDEYHKSINFLWTQWKKPTFINSLGTNTKPIKEPLPRISNHLEGNYYLGYKKNLYRCLYLYYSLIGKDIADTVPLTFYIRNGIKDKEYIQFESFYKQCENVRSSKNMWILKPGESTNRGNGIIVANELKEIESYVLDSVYTCIIQKYIECPLLFGKRKFDIRCFALITSVNGYIKAYYFKEGYLRTSSREYSTENFSKCVHLTNEAVQIKYDSFGKYESGNKVSYEEFQQYLNEYSKNKHINFHKDILPKIKVIYKITR
jgi:hypothetical protein